MSDDDTSSDVARSKVELDVEKHLLGTTVQLSDGTEGMVFSRGPKNESHMFLYNCHLCGVPNLPGERCLQTHIAGRKHQTRLQQTTVDADAFNAPLGHKSKIQMNIAPGEPIPPGFENEVKPVAEIQASLDKFKESCLVGLEYVVELTQSYQKEPGYVCILCDKRGDPRTIVKHIISFNHRLKYLEKHFPTVIKELAPYRYNPNARNIMPTVVLEICTAIEKHHGRLTPCVYDNDQFSKNRGKILLEIISDKHIDEKRGPNFVEFVDKKRLQEAVKTEIITKDAQNIGKARENAASGNSLKRLKPDSGDFSRRERRNSLDSISSLSSLSNDEFRSERRARRLGNGRHNRSRSRSRNRAQIRARRSRSRSIGSAQKKKRRSQSPAYRFVRFSRSPPFSEPKRDKPNRKAGGHPNYTSGNEVERGKWEKYRQLVEAGASSLERTLKEHEKNPEKHPLYPDEWKKFWNRRYRELQAEKKDPTKHDYKPEWIVFWTSRMKELHEEALEKMKSEIKKKLNLQESDKTKLETEDDKMKAHVIDISDDDSLPPVPTKKAKRSPPQRASRHSTSPISDDDRDIDLRIKNRDRERERERDRERERSRYGPTDDFYYHPSRGYYPPASGYGYRTMDPHSYPKYEPAEKEEEKDEGPLTVVAVLRLLTALEEHLGSLGPKIVDLLAKALALEKVKANSADELLLNEDNSVFFETIKEKLKGQLIAGVLDQHKIKAVKKAIKDIAGIIHQVNANAKKKEEETKKEESETKVSEVRKIDEFDRKIVSSKLAAALVVEDKTDISTKQMDQLINVFILMVKISKERKSIISVADILEDLNVDEKPSPKEQPIVDEKIAPAPIIYTPVAAAQAEKEEDEDDEVVPQSSMGSLESLTDSDLQILLQNFKHLSSEEQHHLIAHLKKLETIDPLRVEKLRKFVDISDLKKDKSQSPPPKNSENSASLDADDDNKQMNLAFDTDDDDDYTFDDVVKAASNNLRDKGVMKTSTRQDSIFREREEETSNMSKASSASNANLTLADTKNLIASLMGSLQKNLKDPNFSSIPTIVGRQIQDTPPTGGSSASDPNYSATDTTSNAPHSGMTSEMNYMNVNHMNFNPNAGNVASNMNTMNIDQNMNPMNPNNFSIYPNTYGAQQNFNQQNYANPPFSASGSGGNVVPQMYNQQQMFSQSNNGQRRFF